MILFCMDYKYGVIQGKTPAANLTLNGSFSSLQLFIINSLLCIRISEKSKKESAVDFTKEMLQLIIFFKWFLLSSNYFATYYLQLLLLLVE